jgi:hypothetical protein
MTSFAPHLDVFQVDILRKDLAFAKAHIEKLEKVR